MSRRRKQPRVKTSRKKPAPVSTPNRISRADILRDAVKGLIVIALFLSLSLYVHETTFGKQMSLVSYNLFQSRLLSSEPSPVTIVDITDLEPQDANVDHRVVTATPRDALRNVIAAISGQHPRAIGVDIDFAPDDDGLLDEDPAFFRFCIDTAGVPVFLGIQRTLGETPAKWLGGDAYKGLAANILIPNAIGSDGRMIHLISVPGSSSVPMSVALAKAYNDWDRKRGRDRGRGSSVAGLLSALHVVDSIEVMSQDGVDVEHFMVDFSTLESMKQETIRTISPEVLASHREKFEGKVVLLGDATLGKSKDTFVPRGRQEPYPGVFLHASAAHTLIKGPLFTMTTGGRLAIDIASSLIVLMAVLLIRLHYNQAGEAVATHRLQGILTIVIVVVPILAGVWFVRVTRIMWDDFLLALAALMFHPTIERLLNHGSRQIRKSVPAAWRRLVLDRKQAGI